MQPTHVAAINETVGGDGEEGKGDRQVMVIIGAERHIDYYNDHPL